MAEDCAVNTKVHPRMDAKDSFSKDAPIRAGPG